MPRSQTVKTKTKRRDFVKSVSANVLVAPYFVRSTALGLGAKPPASDRLVMGGIGCGGKGQHNTRMFLNDERVQFVAACDVDRKHLNTGVEEINKHYGNQDCAAMSDFRELISRSDIDVVHVSTPDHWHAVASVWAMAQCKDVYCEKPLANSFGESKAIRDAAMRTGRILQCGSQERSNNNCRFAAELVRSGRIGKLQSVRIQMPCEQEHHQTAKAVKSLPTPEPVPEHFDWDMWLGHNQPSDYWEGSCHFWWRFILNFGGGEMTDRGAHIIDIAQLGMGTDSTGPVEFEASGVQTPGSPYDAFWDFTFTNTYASGVKLVGTTDGPRGLKFEGTEGWLFVAIHGGALSASNPKILPDNVRQGKRIGVDQTDDDLQVNLGRSRGHHTNFLDCVIHRKQPMAAAEIGHRTATICHLNNIAMRVGRKLKWDPQREELIDDVEAGKLLMPKMRKPWVV